VSFATYPSLRGKVVLVTGGATGIGADIVRAFIGQGAHVGFLDIQDDAAHRLLAPLSGTFAYRHCDITDIAALQAAITSIADELGPITVLVNNAANDKREPVATVSVGDWDLSQDINLRPHFFAAQAVHPGMKAAGGGSIVNFSSIAWRAGAFDMTPYATAKAAVLGLTFALAKGYGPDNIRVNAVEPGAVITPRQRELWYPRDEQVQAMVDRQAIRRVLTGDEVARTVLFLASDDSRMMTKQVLRVDAGLR
jgi:NAD(P)-dependent dehydrogenase (short-subunit alcohol dehydrogenase family)